MDHHVALAMANLNIPQSWNVLGSHSGNGEQGIIFQNDLLFFISYVCFIFYNLHVTLWLKIHLLTWLR